MCGGRRRRAVLRAVCRLVPVPRGKSGAVPMRQQAVHKGQVVRKQVRGQVHLPAAPGGDRRGRPGLAADVPVDGERLRDRARRAAGSVPDRAHARRRGRAAPAGRGGRSWLRGRRPWAVHPPYQPRRSARHGGLALAGDAAARRLDAGAVPGGRARLRRDRRGAHLLADRDGARADRKLRQAAAAERARAHVLGGIRGVGLRLQTRRRAVPARVRPAPAGRRRRVGRRAGAGPAARHAARHTDYSRAAAQPDLAQL